MYKYFFDWFKNLDIGSGWYLIIDEWRYGCCGNLEEYFFFMYYYNYYFKKKKKKIFVCYYRCLENILVFVSFFIVFVEI